MYDVVCMILAVAVEHRLVTDGQTDGRTDRHILFTLNEKRKGAENERGL